MVTAALILSLTANAAVAGVLLWTRSRLESNKTAPPPVYDDSEVRAALASHRNHLEELTAAVADLEEADRDQTLAIAEGIERVDRAERRVRSAVGRARKRMEELGYVDEGLEAEAAQLHAFDGDNGAGEGVQPMREGVESNPGGHPRPDMSAFPGRW